MNPFPQPKREVPEAARAYIGRTLKLRVTERDHPRIGKVKIYHLDDPQMEAELLALSPNVRIFPPGWGGTMDNDPFRLNFIVEEDGTISRAYRG